MKKLTVLLISLMLTVSFSLFAAAEESAGSASHILVVSFSATCTTRGVAEKPAESPSADLYEIFAGNRTAAAYAVSGGGRGRP